MKKKLLVIAAIAVLVGIALYVTYKPRIAPTTPVQSEPVQSTTPEPKTPPTPSELLELTNAERAKVGVAPLKLDDRLNQSAQWKAEDMQARGYFDHQDPTTRRRNGIDKINALITCYRVSENLTDNVSLNDSRTAISAFMFSPSHRDALLDKQYNLVGFGVAGTKIVQHFCEL